MDNKESLELFDFLIEIMILLVTIGFILTAFITINASAKQRAELEVLNTKTAESVLSNGDYVYGYEISQFMFRDGNFKLIDATSNTEISSLCLECLYLIENIDYGKREMILEV